MKATAVISLAVSFTLGALFLLHIRTYRSTADTGAATTAPHAAAAAAPAARGSAPSVAERQLLEVIRVQNETIALLEGVLANKLQAPKLSELLEAGRQKDAQIQNLLAQVRRQQEQLTKAMVPAAATAAATTKPPTSSLLSGLLTASTPAKPAVTAAAAASCAPGTPAFVTEVPLHGLDQECERKYGMQLVDLWRANREVWCEDTKNTQAPEADKSRLVCYPYHQEHKKRDGRGPDLFCEATNVFVDFSKVHGDAAVGRKPPLGQQYLAFDRGSIFSAACERTPQFKPHLFMPHHAAQMASFWSAKEVPTPPAPGSYDTEDAPTYLLARDEDCENSFHSTADFMNVFLVMSALGIDPRKQKVVLFDKHLDGPYVELIQKAFSPSHPVGRHQQYKGRTVLFKRLVFHLESPAGLIFPKVALPGPLRCHGTGLFNEYRKFVLQAFKLYDVPPPEVPTITLSLRYRTPHKNVGRVLKNKDEVVKLLQEGTMVKVNVIDAAKMSFAEQLAVIRQSNVLVGVHGAGLMFIMFAADEAVLVELHPSYRQDRHFRHAARMTGKIYMPLRATQRETCEGTSDNVVMPMDEFRRTIDGAVRIARQFHNGLAECGLVCPSGVLALDPHLDALYSKYGQSRGSPVNTAFPC